MACVDCRRVILDPNKSRLRIHLGARAPCDICPTTSGSVATERLQWNARRVLGVSRLHRGPEGPNEP